MRRFYSYELRDLIQDGPIVTYDAEEIASRRKVYVHLLTDDLDEPEKSALLQEADSLASVGTTDIFEAGEYAGSAYVVTAASETFARLREGLTNVRRELFAPQLASLDGLRVTELM